MQRLVAEVLRRAAYPPGGHDEKRLLNILEDYPRDELLQIDVDDLFDTALAIAGLQERRRVRVFGRAELFGRFVTCMVYMPRDRYNTVTRADIQDLLVEAYGGSSAEWSTRISESVLARTLFHIRVESGRVKDVDLPEIEARIGVLLQEWGDDFAHELVRESGEDNGVVLARRYGEAFPPAYRESFTPRSTVADVHQIETLGADGRLGLSVYREPGQPNTAFKLKLYRSGERVSLTSVMPSLTNLGVTVVDENPYEVLPKGRDPVWIYDFSLEHSDEHLDFGEVSTLFERAFSAVWHGEIADNGFNRLVLCAGLGHQEIGILHAYARYLRQTGAAYSRDFIEQTLTQHAEAARLLIEFFRARFDPAQTGRAERADAISKAFFAIVEEVTSLDQDRILRRFHNLIDSTLRTNYFQRTRDHESFPYLAFKLDPKSIQDLPEPRPQYEIFVYSPRFEGVHLRAGSVARSGLRWSERNEDYRTEVLGLVKAQMVKNAVIVPAGAKGGFVLKRPPTGTDPAALRDEVVECYKLFVSALLDLTDNLVDGAVVPPERTVRHDGDDTYLVVAADKGTATFSDIANELATTRGFWLGDAFASGGSNGYDHKAIGITARGAWESVKHHFRELGRDIQSEPFTAVGIGDMSGDVFGNGMLLSAHTRLVAAFDHRHIFLDPDPDAHATFSERARLFKLPRSSWADYDESIISPGGGVYPRSAKSIRLSIEARAALGIQSETLTPDELISAVLRAPVDLLWNGGIGTYVKASDESHAAVGDKANDAIRVNASELRAAVVGEGGNLGVTQLGRIEFARSDGRIYTDAIDNAAGVDTSDHEVNIKILLDEVVLEGDLTEKQRNELLAEMTNEVALLVLTNNRSQTQALSTARTEAASMVDVHARYLADLEGRGLISCNLERLPDAETMAERRLEGTGLSTPELAVLLAYTKNILNSDLLASPVPDDEAFAHLLMDYFPEPLRTRYPERVLAHRLRREIIATRISNLVVDRGGTSMVYRLSKETSAPHHEIAAAHIAAWEIFQLDRLGTSINDLETVLAADQQSAIHLSGRQLAERATRLLVRNRPHPFSTANAIADLAVPVQDILLEIPAFLAGADRLAFESRMEQLVTAKVPHELACQVAALADSLAALDIVEVASDS
ncbi:MAG: NAD-glutamate dehydrogenase, partial [Acidimicrobiales bacterium]